MLKKLFIIAPLCLTIASCADYDWDFDHNTELCSFDIISSDITIDLTAEDTDMATEHTIEWEKSKAADYSQVFYKVLFSAKGDFGSPDYELEPAAIGTDNKLVISNRNINIIAEACGVEQNSHGDIKWTVCASNGINNILAGSVHTISVSRPAGFAYIPESVAVKGSDSTEAMKKTAEGIFEAFMYLGEGEYNISDIASVDRNYTISSGKLVQNGCFKAVSAGKIHHLTVDYNSATATIASVEEVGVWYNGSQSVISVMTPAENNSAVWSSTFLFESVDNDLKYKFRLTEKDTNGEEQQLFYGYSSETSRPQSATSPASYFYLVPENGFNGSSYCYSFNRTLHNQKMLSVSINLRPTTENYTHNVTVR